MSAAPRRGAMARSAFARSVRGRRTCSWPAMNRLRYPSPANAALLWPLGKLRQPSWRVWWFVSVQISKVTSWCAGVPFAGLQRARRSGRGRPTAFLIMSVMKVVRRKEIARPRRVTWVLWGEGL